MFLNIQTNINQVKGLENISNGVAYRNYELRVLDVDIPTTNLRLEV